MIKSKSIIEYCKQCRPGKNPDSCTMKDCPLWVYRKHGGVPKSIQKDPKITRGKRIKKHCLECCNGSHNEVRLCHIEECALHEHRVSSRVKKDSEPSG